MILIALGANLPSRYGTPAETLEAAADELEARGVRVVARSRVWLSAPVPFDPDQDWYHNSVVSVETDLPAHDLLDFMLTIEGEFGRIRSIKNAPRLLDLDLIAYHDDIIKDGERLIVPHPRMNERLFVIKPLEDISNSWVHPVSGQNITEILQNISSDQQAKPLEDIV
jgi:2-amino-4-hydroxy-6-hydroxymethyldihydropteridine diphosphokinase